MIEVRFSGTRDEIQAQMFDFLGLKLMEQPPPPPAVVNNPAPVAGNLAPATPTTEPGAVPMNQQQFIDGFRTWAQQVGVPAAKAKLESLGVRFVTDVPAERYAEVLASLPVVVK